MTRNFARTASVLAALWIAGSAGAADTLFAYDGCDYAAGADLNGLAGGQGWADVWRTKTDVYAVMAMGLGYVDAEGHALDVRGGSLSVAGVGSTLPGDVASRLSLADFGDSGTTLWVSFLQRNVAVTDGAVGAGVTVGAPNNTSMVGGLIKTSEGSIRSGIRPFNSTTVATSRGSIGPDQTLMHVLRFDFQATGNDTLSLWRNPLLVGDPDAPDVTASFTNMSSLLSGISLVTQLRPAEGISFGYDELRIGNTWAAVTPIAAVPEPASWLLLLAGGAVAVAMRRHNRSA